MADMAFVPAAVVMLMVIVVEVALLTGLVILVVEVLYAGRAGACAIPIRAQPCSVRIGEGGHPSALSAPCPSSGKGAVRATATQTPRGVPQDRRM